MAEEEEVEEESDVEGEESEDKKRKVVVGAAERKQQLPSSPRSRRLEKTSPTIYLDPPVWCSWQGITCDDTTHHILAINWTGIYVNSGTKYATTGLTPFPSFEFLPYLQVHPLSSPSPFPPSEPGHFVIV